MLCHSCTLLILLKQARHFFFLVIYCLEADLPCPEDSCCAPEAQPLGIACAQPTSVGTLLIYARGSLNHSTPTEAEADGSENGGVGAEITEGGKSQRG